MPSKRDFRREDIVELSTLMAQGDLRAKAEFARRMLEGEGMNKNEVNAVSLLQDCVRSDIPDAMVMLAKCYALGRGVECNKKQAEKLLSGAAKHGDEEAALLVKLFKEWRKKNELSLWSLYQNETKKPNHGSFCVFDRRGRQRAVHNRARCSSHGLDSVEICGTAP